MSDQRTPVLASRPADTLADQTPAPERRKTWRKPTIERLPYTQTQNGPGAASDGAITTSLVL